MKKRKITQCLHLKCEGMCSFTRADTASRSSCRAAT
jgi:hypothetical protein